MASKTDAHDYILTSVTNGVRTIKFNKPHRKNAICSEMYVRLAEILNKDALDDTVVATILTGVGDYYSSGNDLTMSTLSQDESFAEVVDQALNNVDAFVTAMINYPKLLIAVVNGPVVGIAATTLGLCDAVYASDRATFSTPFVKLGMCPEGASSYLFPRIMGRSMATEMLLMGNAITAEEAYKCGLVAKVVPHKKLNDLFATLQKCGKLSVKSVKNAKRLIMENLKDHLHKTHKIEFEQLKVCFQSDDFFEGIMQFLSKKSKL